MNTKRLYEILRDTTAQYRKTDAVVEKQTGHVTTTHIYAMPPADDIGDNFEKVDCHFIVIAVDKAKAKPIRDELIDILRTYQPREHWTGGPSYIHVGGVIGDQGAAFQLFALGAVLGLWDVSTPETLGMDGPMADQMAGAGMIYAIPHKPFLESLAA